MAYMTKFSQCIWASSYTWPHDMASNDLYDLVIVWPICLVSLYTRSRLSSAFFYTLNGDSQLIIKRGVGGTMEEFNDAQLLLHVLIWHRNKHPDCCLPLEICNKIHPLDDVQNYIVIMDARFQNLQ